MVNPSILVERPKSAFKICSRLGLQEGSGAVVACYAFSCFGRSKACYNIGGVTAQTASFIALILELSGGVCDRPS